MGGKTADQVKGQHGIAETVKVKADNEQGYVVIDAEDLDKSVHEKYTGAEAGAPKKGTAKGGAA